MKRFKHLLLLAVILITAPSLSFSQKDHDEKFKTRLSSEKKKVDIDELEWEDWSNWERSYATIVHYKDSGTFVVYDEGKISKYTIVQTMDKQKDEAGDVIEQWTCVSETDLPCVIKLVTLRSYKNKQQFYLELPNRKVAYHLK